MSNFTVISNIDALSTEAANKLLSAAARQENAALEASALIDPQQLIVLAGKSSLTYNGVMGGAYELAINAMDYSVGRIFDVFTNKQLAYGNVLATAIDRIRSGETPSSAMTRRAGLRMTRRQIQITSEPTQGRDGRKYVTFQERNINVSNGSIGPWSGDTTLNGADVDLLMYVAGESTTTPLFQEATKSGQKQIFLADPIGYDKAQSAIVSSGNVGAYEATLIKHLQGLNPEDKRALASDQELMFLTVMSLLVAPTPSKGSKK
jgi:hypothetical protein